MVFRKGQSGNPAGRKPKEKTTYTRKEIREKELLFVIRKIKPNVHLAMKKVIEILNDEEATENGKLRASALILQTYKDLVKEAYSGNDDDVADSVEDSGAVFSLKMVGNEDTKEDKKD